MKFFLYLCLLSQIQAKIANVNNITEQLSLTSILDAVRVRSKFFVRVLARDNFIHLVTLMYITRVF